MLLASALVGFPTNNLEYGQKTPLPTIYVKTHWETSETGARQEVVVFKWDASSHKINPLPRDEPFVIISMTGSSVFQNE